MSSACLTSSFPPSLSTFGSKVVRLVGWLVTHQGEEGGKNGRPREDGTARHHEPLLRESSAGLAEPRPEHVDGGLALHLNKKRHFYFLATSRQQLR